MTALLAAARRGGGSNQTIGVQYCGTEGGHGSKAYSGISMTDPPKNASRSLAGQIDAVGNGHGTAMIVGLLGLVVVPLVLFAALGLSHLAAY